MSDMRVPNKDDKIGGWSITEIKTAFDNEVSHVRGMRIQVTDQQMRPAHLLNSILLWYFSQSRAIRDGIIRDGAARYVRCLESDVPLVIDDVDAPIAADDTVGINPAVLDRPKSRKKKG